jgi:DNA-binding transcriptional MerR regulator
LTFPLLPVRLFAFAVSLLRRSQAEQIIVSEPTNHEQDASLAGRRIALVGKLASMSRRDAEQMIRASGGRVVEASRDQADTIVVPDDADNLQRFIADDQLLGESSQQAFNQGKIEVIRESELWARLGLVDAGQGIARLYTPAMLSELLRAPIAAIRHWHRHGLLVAKREVRRLPYFDFEEVRVARKLVQLLAAGASLSSINRRLVELARLQPGMSRPLADPAVVVEGRRLVVRRGDNLAEPSGQLLIEFDAGRPGESPGGANTGRATRFAPAQTVRRAARIPLSRRTCALSPPSWRPTRATARPSKFTGRFSYPANRRPTITSHWPNCCTEAATYRPRASDITPPSSWMKTSSKRVPT